MPLCVTPDCPRSPTSGRRGRCRRCYEADPSIEHANDGQGARGVLVDPVQVLFFAGRAERDRLQALAKALGVSASEVIRRALAKALETP